MDHTAAEPTLTGIKSCPRCAEDVKSAALVCRFCNYDFREARASTNVGVESVPKRASFGRRLTAYLFDTIGLYIPIILLWYAMDFPGGTATNLLGAAYLIGLGAYFVWSWMRGATVGMKALGLRVVDVDGRPLTFELALKRLGALVVVQLALTIVLPLVLFLVFRIFRRPYWIDTVTQTKVVLVS